MPIIKRPDDDEMVTTSFRLPKNLRDEVKKYCKWGKFKEGYFLVAAIRYVLSHDKEWQAQSNKKNKSSKKTKSKASR